MGTKGLKSAMQRTPFRLLALLAVAACAMRAADLEEQIRELKTQIEAQEKQIESLRDALERQKKLLETLERPAGSPIAEMVTTSPAAAPPAPAPSPSQMIEPSVAPAAKSAASSLSFRIGQAEFTPSGFMDLTFYRRSTNVASGIGTAFGDIPFGNTPAGRLSESRLSTQNSRISLRVESAIAGFDVMGYLESDFLGAAPGNAAITSNSDPLRLRQYWASVRRGRIEVLGGQAWSLLTPNRVGLGSLPRSLSYSQDMDTNYQVGLTWARQPVFRIITHATDKWTLGISLEAPEQFIGGAVRLPAALSSTYPAQVNTGAAGFATPNLFPDIITKLAYDTTFPSGRSFHAEVAGLYREFRTYNPLTGRRFTKPAGGGSLNLDLELAPNLHLIANQFASDGGGRYIFGLGPDMVIRADGGMTLVHSASTMDGFEYQVSPRTLLFAYYGGAWFGRTVAIDDNGRPVGFGFPGSPANANRTIQEPSFGVIQTFWRSPSYGALQLITQYSYLTRSPWFVPPASPSNAAARLVYLDLRYTLP